MEVIRVVTGLLDENCYILKIDNNCLVVDPGDDYSKIKITYTIIFIIFYITIFKYFNTLFSKKVS